MTPKLPLNLIKDTDNPRCNNALRRLELYDFSLIRNSCIEKYGWSQNEAKDVELETKQFLALPFLDPHFYHIPEEKVDDFWHRMILHTQWYSHFCEETYGFFLHHTPEPKGAKADMVNRDRSIQLAKLWFGKDWSNLVRTCTQCRGPSVPTALAANDKYLLP
ncbi:MAG: hypothetical protein KUG78_21385 [Kangiellaceae bacterium]|nr:hypothetical protein [Kangiellaceae bacterium]